MYASSIVTLNFADLKYQSIEKHRIYLLLLTVSIFILLASVFGLLNKYPWYALADAF